MRVRCFAVRALLLAAIGCAPESSHPIVGDATGAFETEIFFPGSVPSNVGDGAVTVTLGGDERVLAQSAAAYAVDGAGNQTLDPANAVYFAVQIFQYVSETKLEIFEVRVLPASWTGGATIPVDGVDTVAFFGTVSFDGNGNAVDATIQASSDDGELTLTEAGRDPRAPVSGSFAVELSND